MKFQLTLKSTNKTALKAYNTFLQQIFKKINLNISQSNLPTKKKIFTLLKSPHVYKKAREQFKITSHTTLFTISGQISNQYLKTLILNKPKCIKIFFRSLYFN